MCVSKYCVRALLDGLELDHELQANSWELFQNPRFFLKQNTPDEDCSRYFAGVLVGSPSLRLTESEKQLIYRIQVEDALEDMHLGEEDKVPIKALKRIMFFVQRSYFLSYTRTPDAARDFMFRFHHVADCTETQR